MLAKLSAMHQFDHVIAGAILLVSLLQAFADPEKLKDAPRLTFYKTGALTGIILGGLILLGWSVMHRPLADFGLYGWTGRTWISLPLALLWPCLLLTAYAACTRAFAPALAAYYGKYSHLMPAAPRELPPAFAAGIFAGLGEEIAYRGFLLWYLNATLGLLPAVLIVTAAFGIAHGYQGRKGILFASIAGLVLAGAYLASHSLLLVLWMHASYNVLSFTLGYRLLSSAQTPSSLRA